VKVKGGVTQTQVVEGTISKDELLALVRETFSVPEGASARFYLHGPHNYGIQMQVGAYAPQLVDLTRDEPLRFRITWDVDAHKQG
jgi:hypothetical protein